MSKATLTKAKAALSALFSDTSVSKEKTLEELQELRDEVEMNIDAIKSDIRREQ